MRLREAGVWISYVFYLNYVVSAEHGHAVQNVRKENKHDAGETVHFYFALHYVAEQDHIDYLGLQLIDHFLQLNQYLRLFSFP